MDTNKKIREHVSALSDGALPDADLELAMAALQAPDGRQAWDVYHRIGDELRAQASPDLSVDFSARLAARLAAEPTLSKRPTGAAAGSEPSAAPAAVAASSAASAS